MNDPAGLQAAPSVPVVDDVPSPPEGLSCEHFHFEVEGSAPFRGILCIDRTTRLIIAVNGKDYRLLWSDRWGPCVGDRHGDPANKQPGPRHEFWRAASLWNRQGKRREGLRAVWHEPAPEILQNLGRYRRGIEIRVVQAGEDPFYSRTIWLPHGAEGAGLSGGAEGDQLGTQARSAEVLRDHLSPPQDQGEGHSAVRSGKEG